MFIAVGGVNPNDGDDPFWIVPPVLLDTLTLEGPLSKEQREDLQINSFVSNTAPNAKVEIEKGNDPPDRIIYLDKSAYAVELTEFTVSDVRQELAQTRQLGRKLYSALVQNRTSFKHLEGRRVVLGVFPNNTESLRSKEILDYLCNALADDCGCIGDGIDLTLGFPEKLPTFGIYGQHESINIMVYRDGDENKFSVSSTCQTEIRLSHAIKLLYERIQTKDISSNEILLITCGLPDENGFTCPLDNFMFEFIRENVSKLEISTKYLKAVYLHLWNSGQWAELHTTTKQKVWPSSNPI